MQEVGEWGFVISNAGDSLTIPSLSWYLGQKIEDEAAILQPRGGRQCPGVVRVQRWKVLGAIIMLSIWKEINYQYIVAEFLPHTAESKPWPISIHKLRRKEGWGPEEISVRGPQKWLGAPRIFTDLELGNYDEWYANYNEFHCIFAAL